MKAKLKNPVIKSGSHDGSEAVITFSDGNDYKLQHPGNRAYLNWQKEHYSITKGFDEEAMLDNFFEHCVFPEGNHEKPDLDKIQPGETTAWTKLMHKFLAGELHSLVETAKADGKKNKPASSEP